MNIFFTGGTGFLGYNTVIRLLDEGHHVFALVRKMDCTLCGINNEKLTLVHGSLENLTGIEVPPIDACVHFAWMGVNRLGVDNPDIQRQNVINS